MSFILLGILNSQAAGAVGPEPDFLSSAPLWLDAADASTITESSGSVSQWDNKGTKENFTQATSASQPTTGVATLNGLNVIRFNSDYLEGSSLTDFKFLHDGSQYFIAAVAKYGFSANNGEFNTLMGNIAGVNENPGLFFGVSGASPNLVVYNISTGRGDNDRVLLILDNGLVSGNTFSITSELIDGDNATASNRIDYYKNNTQGTVDNTFSNTPSTANSSFALEIAASGNGSGANGELELAELVIVSGADATETNRQAVVDYLNAKWGVF